MVWFRCKNCSRHFEANTDFWPWGSWGVVCPCCESGWTEYLSKHPVEPRKADDEKEEA